MTKICFIMHFGDIRFNGAVGRAGGGGCCSTRHQTLFQTVALCPFRTVQGIEAFILFFHGSAAPSGKGPPQFRGLVITLSRTPLDEWSARRRDLYLTTHNTHKRQTSMPTARFEPTIPASQRPHSHELDRAGTGPATQVNTNYHVSFGSEWYEE